MLANKKSGVSSRGEDSKVSGRVDNFENINQVERSERIGSHWERPHESAIESKWERDEEEKRVQALFEVRKEVRDSNVRRPISSKYDAVDILKDPKASLNRKFSIEENRNLETLEKSRKNISREVQRLEELAQSRKEVQERIERINKVNDTLNVPEESRPAVIETPMNKFSEAVTPRK